MKKFPCLFRTQPSIEQQDFEASPQRGTVLAGFAWGELLLIELYTMYIMLTIKESTTEER
jgi:hypothetical protein